MTIGSHPKLFNKETPPRRTEVHRGRTKILYDGPDLGSFVLYFTDNQDEETPEGSSEATLNGRGVINNRISDLLLTRLQEIGINNHLIRRLNMREQLIRAADVIPFKIHVYNAADQSLSDRFMMEVGSHLSRPLFEMSMGGTQNIVAKEHICGFGWSNELELDDLIAMAQRTNDFLYGYLSAVGLKLLSFSLEFGRIFVPEGLEQVELVIIDEISPETCVFQDIETGLIFNARDKDLSLLERAEAYEFIAEKLGLIKLPALPLSDSSND